MTEQLKQDFLHAFNGEHGERVYKYLADFCMKNKQTFDRNSERMSSFNEGARSVILKIDYIMNWKPKEIKQEEYSKI